MRDNEVTILIVDDDDIDVESFRRALTKQRIANPTVRARDGIEALAILRGTEDSSPLRRPYVILLDINMPRMDGMEFLEALRDDPHHRDAVVFVFTTSDDDRDILGAYDKNVAGYLRKSSAGERLVEQLNMLQLYWRYVELPPESH